MSSPAITPTQRLSRSDRYRVLITVQDWVFQNNTALENRVHYLRHCQRIERRQIVDLQRANARLLQELQTARATIETVNNYSIEQAIRSTGFAAILERLVAANPHIAEYVRTARRRLSFTESDDDLTTLGDSDSDNDTDLL